MKIFHIGAECYPVAKVGGLADVIGALPKYLSNPMRTLNLYKKKRIDQIKIKGMNTDHSWKNVSQEYLELNNLIIAKKYEN